MDEVIINRACPTGCPGDTKGRSNILLSDFQCEQEGNIKYIASANLHVTGMPVQHVYAVSVGRERAIVDMLTSAADTIREYFFG